MGNGKSNYGVVGLFLHDMHVLSNFRPVISQWVQGDIIAVEAIRELALDLLVLNLHAQRDVLEWNAVARSHGRCLSTHQ
jgi:hypothetical protein